MLEKSRRLLAILMIAMMVVGLGILATGCADKNAAATDNAAQTTATSAESCNVDEQSDNSEKSEKSDNVKDPTDVSKTDEARDNKKDNGKNSKKSTSKKNSGKSGNKSGSKSANTPAKKPGNSGEKKDEPVQQASIATISVDGYCSGKTVTISEGDTVYDVLRKSGASLKTEKSVYGVYVVGINGLCEGDKGKASGWTYTLNGEMVMKSADKVTVSNGAVVKWTFVTNGI